MYSDLKIANLALKEVYEVYEAEVYGPLVEKASSEKRDVLRKLIEHEGDKCTNAIIFCNRKVDVDIVAKSLVKHGYNAAPIHGDLEQSQRMRTLEGFRDGSVRLLIASDVAARGLDVPSVSHVFNFDVPGHAEDYVHRIGRTGRAGRDGKAFTIVNARDEKNFEDVEKLMQREIPRVELPGVQAPTADAPEEAGEEKPKPKRTRTRKPRNAPKEAAAEAPAASVSEQQPAQEQPAQAQPAEPAASAAPEAEAANDSADKKPARSRSRSRKTTEQRDDNRSSSRGGRDNNVVGMGDHMPEFIALSFDERRAS